MVSFCEEVLSIIPLFLVTIFFNDLRRFLSFASLIFFEIPRNPGLLIMTQNFDGSAIKLDTLGAFLES